MLVKIEQLDHKIATLVGLILVLGVGLIDYLTGRELSFSLFYLLPVFWFTWLLGKRPGLLASALCALLWYLNEVVSGQVYAHAGIYYWNSGIRFGFFLVVTLLLAKLKHTLAQEAALARYDFLTGAVNSRYFYEILQSEVERSRRYQHSFTLAYFDLDNFKDVNDRLGHQVGDRVLAKVAESTRANLRSSDILGRLGGDEFALLLPETDHKMAKVAIQKTQDRLLKAMQDQRWPVTFSIGVVTLENPSLTPDEIIKLGDDLMYQVKVEGKNALRYAIYRDFSEMGAGIAVTPGQVVNPTIANLAAVKPPAEGFDLT